jgi:hypothetical protein
LDRRGYAVASRAPVSAEKEGVACSSVGLECWGRQKEKDRAIEEHTAAASAWAPDPVTAPSIVRLRLMQWSFEGERPH